MYVGRPHFPKRNLPIAPHSDHQRSLPAAPFNAHRQNYSENRPQNASVISVASAAERHHHAMTRRTPTISARQYQTRSISQANSTTNSMVAIRNATHPTANNRG